MRSIYLVDDQPVLNKINKRFISMIDPEIAIYDFTEPQIALNNIVEHKPMLILLDLNMPEMSGWEFLDQLNLIDMDMKVIILTSSDSQKDKATASLYPTVKEYIIKPLSKAGLADIISRYF